MIKGIKAGDILIAGLIILIALAMLFCFFSDKGQDGNMLVVSCNGAKESYPLDIDRVLTYQNNGYTLKAEIKEGRAQVIYCNCPDRVCMHSGAVSRVGQTIVCLPCKVTLRIVGEEERYDFIAG